MYRHEEGAELKEIKIIVLLTLSGCLLIDLLLIVRKLKRRNEGNRLGLLGCLWEMAQF